MENEETNKSRFGDSVYHGKVFPVEEKTGFESSKELSKLFLSLSKAQGAMEAAKKDTSNEFFKSKYADLHSCWGAIRKPFLDQELTIIQLNQIGVDFKTEGQAYNNKAKKMMNFCVEGKTVIVLTILGHSSGQWISNITELKPTKTDPQGMGSAITYARRYGLMSIAGIAPEEDDGNAASGNSDDNGSGGGKKWNNYQSENPNPNPEPTKKSPPKNLAPGLVTISQLKRLNTIAGQTGWTKENLKKVTTELYGHDTSKKLTVKEYNHFVEIVEKNNPYDFFEVMEGEKERLRVEEEGKNG